MSPIERERVRVEAIRQLVCPGVTVDSLDHEEEATARLLLRGYRESEIVAALGLPVDRVQSILVRLAR